MHVQSRARVRSQNVHRHVLWVAPVAPTSGVRVQQTKGNTKITSKSVLHPLMEGLTRDDLLAGAPVFHISLVESEQASLTTGKGTGGLWSWPFRVSRAFVLALGELNSKNPTPFSRGLERA